MAYMRSGIINNSNLSADGLVIPHQESITLNLADFIRSCVHFSPQIASCYGLQILL